MSFKDTCRLMEDSRTCFALKPPCLTFWDCFSVRSETVVLLTRSSTRWVTLWEAFISVEYNKSIAVFILRIYFYFLPLELLSSIFQSYCVGEKDEHIFPCGFRHFESVRWRTGELNFSFPLKNSSGLHFHQYPYYQAFIFLEKTVSSCKWGYLLIFASFFCSL